MSDPETLWLNITNIALGAVTLVCLLVLGWEVVREVALARKRAAVRAAQGAHELVLPDLGLTMADGGEKIDEKDLPRHRPATGPAEGGEKNDTAGS